MNETDGFDSDAPKAPASAPEPEPPRWPYFRHFVFAKNCTNKYGHFRIGDSSRGAFPPELVQSYLEAGILVERDA